MKHFEFQLLLTFTHHLKYNQLICQFYIKGGRTRRQTQSRSCAFRLWEIHAFQFGCPLYSNKVTLIYLYSWKTTVKKCELYDWCGQMFHREREVVVTMLNACWCSLSTIVCSRPQSQGESAAGHILLLKQVAMWNIKLGADLKLWIVKLIISLRESNKNSNSSSSINISGRTNNPSRARKQPVRLLCLVVRLWHFCSC